MTFNLKQSGLTHSALPLEYRPRLTEASDSEHSRHYLLPGKVFASAQPVAITTIVGSSVVLCLWDSVNGLGGAAHFLLPEASPSDPGDTKCGNASGELLFRLLIDLGAHTNCLQAKIFGGLQPAVRFTSSQACLGSRNVDAALKFLTSKKIRLESKEVAGNSGRKVIFHTDDGTSWSEAL
jgi:chemotaxis protein CheD